MPDDGMRIYEGLFLVDPGFANKDPEAAVELCKSVLEKHGATIIRAELWAEQRLAYEIGVLSRRVEFEEYADDSFAMAASKEPWALDLLPRDEDRKVNQ